MLLQLFLSNTGFAVYHWHRAVKEERQAERNVLPTLNNLLENREMSLDDGRFLVSSARYDALSTTVVCALRAEDWAIPSQRLGH